MTETLHEQSSVRQMDRNFAEQHIDELYELVQLIPEVTYTPDDLLAEAKPDGRVLHAKWQHSYAITEADKVIGFVMGYEREAETNINYPKNTLYISELAVTSEYQGQGYGRKLLGRFLQDSTAKGFTELSGPLNFTVQTNAAEWNEPVQDLYKSLGFAVTGYKRYDNRNDIVMTASPSTVKL